MQYSISMVQNHNYLKLDSTHFFMTPGPVFYTLSPPSYLRLCDIICVKIKFAQSPRFPTLLKAKYICTWLQAKEY